MQLLDECQLTFVLSTGAQVTVMIAQRADITIKQITNAIEQKKVTELKTKIKDERVESDILVLRGDKIEFFSVLQPRAEPLVHSLDRKILTPS